jgi:hypothetical protein
MRDAWIEHLRPRLAALRLDPAREAEIIEELSQHLDSRYDDLRGSGTSDADARSLAIQELLEPDTLASYMRPLRQANMSPPVVQGTPPRFLLSDQALTCTCDQHGLVNVVVVLPAPLRPKSP